MRNKMIKTAVGLILMLSIGFTTYAYTQIDIEKETSLTLEYVSDDTPISGADFSIYKIAETDATNRYTLTGDFAGYSVSLEDLDSADWLDLATTLKTYSTRDELAPAATGTTDASGKLYFGNLSVGLYLVIGETITVNDSVYTPTPFIISLPNLTVDDTWNYDVTSDIKYEKEPVTSQLINVSVTKAWKKDSAKKRPKSVTVQLLRDKAVYDEVKLSESNSWSHIWKDLDPDSTWQVAEKKVPNDYKVSVSRDGNTFTITNTHVTDESTDNTSDTSDTGSRTAGNVKTGEELSILVLFILMLISVFYILKSHRKEA